MRAFTIVTRLSVKVLVTERENIAYQDNELFFKHLEQRLNGPMSEQQKKTWTDIKGICARHAAFKEVSFWLKPIVLDAPDWPDVGSITRFARELSPEFPWDFVRQEKAPRRDKSRGLASLSGYVEQITLHKKIPVRERDLHDLLNSLSFFMFPQSKMALNARHLIEAPEGLKPGQNRTRTQDLLTILDEGGVIRLINKQGQEKDLIFGHAIYEHIVEGRELRAARLDFNIDDEIIGTPVRTLTELADRLLATWLSKPSNCRAAAEFGHVWIR